ncbi:hypothetical protein ACTWPT_42085 [Nonomuraea sp. 3N208]
MVATVVATKKVTDQIHAGCETRSRRRISRISADVFLGSAS